MAAPSWAEITAQITADQARVDALEVWGTATYDALDTAATQTLEHDFPAAVSAARQQDRAAIAAALTQGALRGWLNPHLRQIARVIGSPETDPRAIWTDLYDYMRTNNFDVNGRAMTNGAVSAVTGTGNGTIVKLVTDERNFTMEGWQADTYLATCILSARQLGVNFEEVFEITGTELSQDQINRQGTGLIAQVKCLSERTSETYMVNPGFETFTGTTPTAGNETTASSTTEFTGWTLTTAANAAASVDVLYRTPPGSSVSQSLRFTNNNSVTQNLVNVRGARIDQDVPYFFGFALYRESNCDGTLTAALGGTNRAVTMSGLSNGAWTFILVEATPGQNNWPLNFDANDLSITFTLASRTTGTLYLDSIVFGPFTRIGAGNGSVRGRGGMGRYLAAYSGTTPFVYGDTMTWTDSNNTRGKNQYWFTQAGLGYLPHVNDGSETWSD